MPKDKERSINPAQQARKQEKNRALKKAKNEQQARRNEKLAHRNPARIQRQIDDLKALESSGEIKPREKAILADLERDLKAITKAREILGDKAPTFRNTRPRDSHDESNKGGILGKRGRDGQRRPNQHTNDEGSDSGDDTDESVRAIPMPQDTPPPTPHEFRRKNQPQQQRYHQHDLDAESQQTGARSQPSTEQKTTYSSAPQLRDLRKEATARFVPTAVKRKQDAVKGVSGELLEPEEMDRLEEAGYYNAEKPKTALTDSEKVRGSSNENDEARRLAEEEARFERELALTGAMDVDDDEDEDESVPAKAIDHEVRSTTSKLHHVEIEEVEDEDL